MTAVSEVISGLRANQPAWEATPRWHRSAIRGLRHDLASDPVAWADSIDPPQQRTRAESLAAEILPLADACRWLEKNATRTLRTRREGRGFGSVSVSVRRKAHGVVLVIGASNYPLFLVAVPAIQALAAGNAVVIKPPPGGEAAAARLREALVAGAQQAATVCQVLDSSPEAATAAIDAGVDHVVFTGSAKVGIQVARRAAEQLIPCTMECSGSDAVLVQPGADLDRVADCLVWGLTFNAGATCIAPRRVFADETTLAELAPRLRQRLAGVEPRRVASRSADDALRLVAAAIEEGASVVSPPGFGPQELAAVCEKNELPPIVLLSDEDKQHELLDADLFAPIVTLVPTAGEGLIEAANRSPFALGASVFGDVGEATAEAAGLKAGCVTINDLIAPTGDARVPFGGAGLSGYGVTRGREGLLGMTRPQAVVHRHGRWLPHLDEPTEALDDLVAGMIQSQHASGLLAKWKGLRRMITGAMAHKRQKD